MNFNNTHNITNFNHTISVIDDNEGEQLIIIGITLLIIIIVIFLIFLVCVGFNRAFCIMCMADSASVLPE
tara:strand:- start:32718 stop:32927 length:210 start_codon:yes stop_codon:yes gene_type:complete